MNSIGLLTEYRIFWCNNGMLTKIGIMNHGGLTRKRAFARMGYTFLGIYFTYFCNDWFMRIPWNFRFSRRRIFSTGREWMKPLKMQPTGIQTMFFFFDGMNKNELHMIRVYLKIWEMKYNVSISWTYYMNFI